MDSKLSQFVTDASEADFMAKSLNLPSVQHLLPHLVASAQSLARPPISDFHVGAAGIGSDGRVFFGVNLEFPGLPLHHSVHAEQFLVTNLAVHRCPRLLSFAVTAAPCGHCRQFLQELRLSSSVRIHITEDCTENLESDGGLSKDPAFRPLSEILPNPFGPHDLLDQETPLLLESHHNRLDLLPLNDASNLCNGNSNVGKWSNGNCDKRDLDEARLRKLALEAANSAHAPYSDCPSGVALMDCEGKMYRGSYIESAAYNPSLGPVQAALVAYVAGGGGVYERIVAAVLVEKEVAKVKQEDTARMMLKVISPKCELKIFYCHSANS